MNRHAREGERKNKRERKAKEGVLRGWPQPWVRQGAEAEGAGGRHSLSHRARAMSGARSLVFCLRYDATASLVTAMTWCDVGGRHGAV